MKVENNRHVYEGKEVSTLRSDVIKYLIVSKKRLDKGQVAMPVLVSHTIGIAYNK